MHSVSRISASAVCLALLAGVAHAGVDAVLTDHLKCFKVKPAKGTPKSSFTIGTLASGIGLAAESGCVIKTPPAVVCAPVSKSGVEPTPPGGGPTPTAVGKFDCYKVKCPKSAPETITGTDQFGRFTVTTSRPQLLCAPATSSPSGAFLDAPNP
ncbi:MAG TPA: hypothetical protein VFD84_10170 [Candidatus Binatia bacterium]|jgi:hypothetical protein|nr:hypothetical protein [Candidatus Binatia bacterium]